MEPLPSVSSSGHFPGKLLTVNRVPKCSLPLPSRPDWPLLPKVTFPGAAAQSPVVWCWGLGASHSQARAPPKHPLPLNSASNWRWGIGPPN